MRPREKRISSNSKGVKLNGSVGGPRAGGDDSLEAAYVVANSGPPTVRQQKAARLKAQRIREANATPEAKAKQKERNDQIKARLRFEMMNAKRNPQDFDMGSMLDWAYDYIPVDDEQKNEYAKMRIRRAYRNKNKE